jgi:hypothetical protein
MKELSYLLITDGSSDKALTHILTWLLRQYLWDWAIDPNWVDPYRLPGRPENATDRLKWQIETGLYSYDRTDLLFVHRDAEKQPRAQRITEISQILAEITDKPPAVCVIPVQMLEAWLLFDEKAIRRAAGNPNGKVQLKLPHPKVERLPDPKKDLCELLKQASELSGRRLKKFNPRQCMHRLAELIDDFEPLRSLSAFQALETDIQCLIEERGWYS